MFIFIPSLWTCSLQSKKNTAMLNEVGRPEGNSMIRCLKIKIKKKRLKCYVQISSENGICNQRSINISVFYSTFPQIPCHFQQKPYLHQVSSFFMRRLIIGVSFYLSLWEKIIFSDMKHKLFFLTWVMLI